MTVLETMGLMLAACLAAVAQPGDGPACFSRREGTSVELHSPHFVFRLDIASGLRAESWENRLTGRTLSLGSGLEVDFDLGLPDGPLETPRLEVLKVEVGRQGETAEAVVRLAAEEPAAAAVVTYRWNAKQPMLHKFVEIANRGSVEWNRLLNVRLGRYETADARVIDKPSGGVFSVPAPREFPAFESTHVERGFPVYAAEEFFFALAHPGGAAEGSGGRVFLRQYPGAKLPAGESFECMEAVYGTANAGEARKAFLAHLRGRTRRVVRGHDRPYAIFEPFGARPDGVFDETEEFVLDNIAKLAAGQRDAGCHFDFYSVDFWVDYGGTLKECDPRRFPNGLSRIAPELNKLGTALGLWIDGSMECWSIGGNSSPAVQACLTHDLRKPETARQLQRQRKAFCRATEPIRSMYTEAFRHHIRQNKVRLLKFDNTACVCVNPNHEHLPGLYSTEPIEDSLIEFFQDLDAECPDVFLMLYWGYRSPWWLLHADTLFDSGMSIEAASPTDQPTPYVRDGVTRKLDQAQWVAHENVPALGKDSLGVWLSDWPWNSQIGKERWEAGFVMDICRGSLLAQVWSDTPWLSPPERRQMAEFIAIFKARPGCFGNSRFILGNPWKNEPYGYCCTDGQRAFLAIHNCCWKDSVSRLELNSAWGLPNGRRWNLYRWYPDPARLIDPRECREPGALSGGRNSPDTRSHHQPTFLARVNSGNEGTFGQNVSIGLRPFEVVLLEVVPSGQPPTLNREFDLKPIPARFGEASRSVALEVEPVPEEPDPKLASPWTPLQPDRAVSAGGATLTIQEHGSVLAGGENPSPDTYTLTASTAIGGITAIRLEVLPDRSLPGNGPGRAVNGNFTLTEFRVTAAPRGKQAEAIPVVLEKAVADFSQQSHGGWPAQAAIDGDPKTGWSVDPREGARHVAVFETRNPPGFAGGTNLSFVLRQGERGHNIGRLRFSVTNAKPPIPLPRAPGHRGLILKGEVPASGEGGMLVLSVKMTRGSQPAMTRNIWNWIEAVRGEIAAKVVPIRPVVGKETHGVSWQAWRIHVEPSARPQCFRLSLASNTADPIEKEFNARFIPNSKRIAGRGKSRSETEIRQCGK